MSFKDVCQALDGAPVAGTDEVLQANPDCECFTPLAAMFCPYGHMLECHYPVNCETANCSHFQREREQ